ARAETGDPGPVPDQAALPQWVPREAEIGRAPPRPDRLLVALQAVQHVAVVVPMVGTVRVELDQDTVAPGRLLPVLVLDLPGRPLGQGDRRRGLGACHSAGED